MVSPPGQPASGPPPLGSQEGIEPNMAAALCYLAGPVTGVLFLVLEPYNRNKNTRFHAFQSIFVSLAFFISSIAVSILAGLPFVGLLFAFVVGFLIPLAGIALWIMLMYKAYNGERWVLPVVGPLAEKQA